MGGAELLDLLVHPLIEPSGEQEVGHDHDPAAARGVVLAQDFGQRGPGDLDEGGHHLVVAAGLEHDPGQPDVVGVGVGVAAAASDHHHVGVLGGPVGAGGGDPGVDGADECPGGAEVPGVDDGRLEVAGPGGVNGFRDVVADVAAGADHQGHDDGGGGVGEHGVEGGIDGGWGEFDEPGLDADVGQQPADLLDQRGGGVGAGVDSGAVAGDDQRWRGGGHRGRGRGGGVVAHRSIQW